MCVSVLPEKVLLGLEEKASPHDIPCLEQSVDRVMEVLHKFKRTFPTFTYRVPYEMGALAYEDSPFRNEAHEIIKKNAGKQSDIGKEFAAFQEGVSSFLAAIERHEHARSAHPIAEAMLDATDDNHENPSGGNSTAKQFADLRHAVFLPDD
jgi:hypothetical protein